ncbi:hypothetical protein GCM10027190_47280 [Spirosoma areae]
MLLFSELLFDIVPVLAELVLSVVTGEVYAGFVVVEDGVVVWAFAMPTP